MVIDMDETRLRTIEQLQEFLRATPEVAFTAPPAGSAADNQRYEHISRVLARFDYPRRSKHERGVVRAYLRRTSGNFPAQRTRLVARWEVDRGTCVVRPSRTSCNAPTPSMVTSAMNAWPISRFRTCTTCASAPTTRRAG